MKTKCSVVTYNDSIPVPAHSLYQIEEILVDFYQSPLQQ